MICTSINTILRKRVSGNPIPGVKGLVGLYMGNKVSNETMSKNPVWKDLSGNRNDVELKNFAWKLGSGCGKYKFDWMSSDWDLDTVQLGDFSDSKITIVNIKNTIQLFYLKTTIKITLKVTGLDINRCIFQVYDNISDSIAQKYRSDGIFDIDYTANEGATRIYFYVYGSQKLKEPITIEQIPDYAGALCFDGVDDFGETIKDLNFTDNYSVVSLVVPFYRPQNQVMFGKDPLKDIYCIYFNALTFYSAGKNTYIANAQLNTNKAKLLVCRRNESIQEIKDVISGTANSIISAPVVDNPGKYYIGRSQITYLYGQFAMFAHAIFDHYISDEELQILSDYWKKEYPELFPDQAWTVTGKTNSDADRATIKNITGNGNDLVLTNFAFAENSGYGLYHQNFNLIYINNATHGTISNKNYKSFTWTALINYPVNNAPTYWGSGRYVNKRFGIILSSNLPDFKINLRWVNKDVVVVRVQELHLGYNLIDAFTDEDFDSLNVLSPGTRIVTPMSPGDWFTLEQVPDYEGYLLTDGVDDQIVSSQNIPLSKDYTIVGDWKLLANENKSCGIVRTYQFYIYNRTSGIQLYVNTTTEGVALKNIKSLKAVCSNGKVYDEDWNEIIIKTVDLITDPNKLYLGCLGSNYTQLAFKNLAIYNDTILTKDQCIRAYNYLQTIKN